MVVLCAPEQLRVFDYAFDDYQCPNHSAVSCQNCPVGPVRTRIVVVEKDPLVPDQFVVVAQGVIAEESGLSVADCSVVESVVVW